MKNSNDARFALLIDADNISYKHISAIMEETTKYGTCTYRRIYGDWAKPHLRNWKEISLDHALTAVQQYSYTSAKNATDTAMTIDAMDMLHTAELTGFILVSSDSDFTPLAMRLREGGKIIIGIGEGKTPTPFKAACNQFILIENIVPEAADDEKESEAVAKATPKPKPTLDRKTLNLLKTTIADLADDDTGWVSLADAGNTILRKKPDFDPRTYGYGKLLSFFRAQGGFDVEDRKTDRGNSIYFVRNKQTQKPKKAAKPKK